MKVFRLQKVAVLIACLVTAAIYFLVPIAKHKKQKPDNQGPASVEAPLIPGYSTDSVLSIFRSRLTPDQAVRLTQLEKQLAADTTDRTKKMVALHELAHFWGDEIGSFPPFIWYESEAFRLENSEKNLTFAAHLLLDSLQQEEDENLRRWKAIQAKDLFERSLILNPKNDSSRVGLGACYLFGGISAAPMTGIRQIKTVVDRDSAFEYGQMTLVKASLLSNQLPKAEERLRIVIRLRPDYLDAVLLLAELREQAGDNAEALTLYKRCLALATRPGWKKALEERIQSLSNLKN